MFLDDFAFGVCVDKPAVFFPSGREAVAEVPSTESGAPRVNFHAGPGCGYKFRVSSGYFFQLCAFPACLAIFNLCDCYGVAD